MPWPCSFEISAAKGDAVPHTCSKPLLPDVLEPSAKKQKSKTKKISKKETRVRQIRQTDERQHDESEKRVITGHMITTRYISTCKNPCTLHSFIVRLPPNAILTYGEHTHLHPQISLENPQKSAPKKKPKPITR